MTEREASLKELFISAREQREKLDELDPRGDEFKDTQRAAFKALEDCRELITQLALYSTNETIEDVSTQDLQFLAVDYLLAELMLKSYGENRLEQLKKASELIEAFLTRLDLYEMLSSSDRKFLERYQENRRNFAVVSTTNPEERRNIKIARFQAEKALKNRLKMLRDKSMANHVDDEVARNLYEAELALYVHESFQSLDMVSQELSILSQISNNAPQPQPTNGITSNSDARQTTRNGDGYSERLDGPVTLAGLGRKGGPLLSPSGKPLQPFTLTDKRTQLRDGVFRSGHNLPTMSIDEYLEEEKRRGGIIEGGGNADAAQQEPDEDDMVQVDAATMKAREWDEFVEANPKGAGNTINRG